MRWNRFCATVASLGVAAAAPVAGSAQSAAPQAAVSIPAEDSAIVRRYTLPLAFDGKALSGPGADLIRREAADAQFVMLAEYLWHVDHASPEFMRALFADLNARYDFNYVAVEQDFFGTQRISEAPVRGDLQCIAAAVRHAPYSLTFINDEELRMFADVGRLSRGKWRPIWGFDQAFGLSLPLEELVRLAPGKEAEAAAGVLLAEARKRETLVPDFGDWRGTRDFEAGHFISHDSVSLLPRLAALRRLYAPMPGSRTEALIAGIEDSARIFSYYARAREKDPPEGVPVGWFNNSEREALMRRQFLSNYRLAAAADGQLPRVLIKAGSNHLVQGRSLSTYSFPIGNFFHELATANGRGAITIALMAVQREEMPRFDSLPPELRVLLASGDPSRPALVDLRPLRNFFAAGHRFGLVDKDAANLRDLVFGADFALFLPSQHGSFQLTAAIPAHSPPSCIGLYG